METETTNSDKGINVKAEKAILRMTIQITSKETGETREVELVGTNIEELENGCDSSDCGS